MNMLVGMGKAVLLNYLIWVLKTEASLNVHHENVTLLPKTLSVDIPTQNVSIFPKTLSVDIPAQNVSSNQEIKWMKPTNLNGSYDVMLVLFFKNLSEKSEVILSVGKSDISMKNYPASFQTLDDLSELVIHQPTKIDPQDDVKILYRGDKNLLIKRVPHSYIMLTKTNI